MPILQDQLNLLSSHKSLKTYISNIGDSSILYTPDPTALIKSSTLGTARATPLAVKYTFGLLEACPSADPHYIQVFSAHQQLLRIYTYTIGGVQKFTIESLPNTSESSILDYATQILNLQYDTNLLKLHIYGCQPSCRYNMFDVASYEFLSQLTLLQFGSTKYYLPALTSVSRDERVRSALHMIDNIIEC